MLEKVCVNTHFFSTCARASGGGHLDLLIWLRDQNCPWNDLTTSHAAKLNKLNTFKWAFENGCPVSPEIIRDACGNAELHQWIKDNVHINKLINK